MVEQRYDESGGNEAKMKIMEVPSHKIQIKTHSVNCGSRKIFGTQ